MLSLLSWLGRHLCRRRSRRRRRRLHCRRCRSSDRRRRSRRRHHYRQRRSNSSNGSRTAFSSCSNSSNSSRSSSTTNSGSLTSSGDHRTACMIFIPLRWRHSTPASRDELRILHHAALGARAWRVRRSQRAARLRDGPYRPLRERNFRWRAAGLDTVRSGYGNTTWRLVATPCYRRRCARRCPPPPSTGRSLRE